MKKKLKPIMLPTEEATALWINKEIKELSHYHKPQQGGGQYPEIVNQHIYLVSDEEIKEGEWMFCRVSSDETAIIKAKHDYPDGANGQFLKIIATTDKSLRAYKIATMGGREHISKRPVQLPQIPESFIKAYVEANGDIDEVSVEMEPIYWDEIKGPGNEGIHSYSFKLTDNNEVIIDLPEEKMYSEKNMRDAISYAVAHKSITAQEMKDKIEGTMKWVEENL